MSNRTVEEIEKQIKDAKVAVEFGKAMERLRLNRDFQEVVIKGYFEQEAIRLVQVKAHPAMQSPDKQAAVVREIDAIGTLRQFFDTKAFFAAKAADEILDSEEALEQLRNEEAE